MARLRLSEQGLTQSPYRAVGGARVRLSQQAPNPGFGNARPQVGSSTVMIDPGAATAGYRAQAQASASIGNAFGQALNSVGGKLYELELGRQKRIQSAYVDQQLLKQQMGYDSFAEGGKGSSPEVWLSNWQEQNQTLVEGILKDAQETHPHLVDDLKYRLELQSNNQYEHLHRESLRIQDSIARAQRNEYQQKLRQNRDWEGAANHLADSHEKGFLLDGEYEFQKEKLAEVQKFTTRMDAIKNDPNGAGEQAILEAEKEIKAQQSQPAPQVSTQQVAKNASAYIGKQYKPGVSAQCATWTCAVLDESGVDTSKLKHKTFAHGYNSDALGPKVPLEQAKPGDVILFRDTYDASHNFEETHVGIVSGDGTFIHRPTKNSAVKESPFTAGTFHGDRVVAVRRPQAAAAKASKMSSTTQEQLELFRKAQQTARAQKGAEQAEELHEILAEAQELGDGNTLSGLAQLGYSDWEVKLEGMEYLSPEARMMAEARITGKPMGAVEADYIQEEIRNWTPTIPGEPNEGYYRILEMIEMHPVDEQQSVLRSLLNSKRTKGGGDSDLADDYFSDGVELLELHHKNSGQKKDTLESRKVIQQKIRRLHEWMENQDPNAEGFEKKFYDYINTVTENDPSSWYQREFGGALRSMGGAGGDTGGATSTNTNANPAMYIGGTRLPDDFVYETRMTLQPDGTYKEMTRQEFEAQDAQRLQGAGGMVKMMLEAAPPEEIEAGRELGAAEKEMRARQELEQRGPDTPTMEGLLDAEPGYIDAPESALRSARERRAYNDIDLAAEVRDLYGRINWPLGAAHKSFLNTPEKEAKWIRYQLGSGRAFSERTIEILQRRLAELEAE